MQSQLIIYSVIIVLASAIGGIIPFYFKFSHRTIQMILSFVAGIVLGISVLHLFPHSLEKSSDVHETCMWLLSGVLFMFLVERFFSFHHHEVEDETPTCSHSHKLTWTGVTVGLSVHSLIAGLGLAAAVSGASSESHTGSLLGLSTFIAILVHKPFDSLTISALLALGSQSKLKAVIVNSLFSLMVPFGIILYFLGMEPSAYLSETLAFCAGVFLCISLSDVLPELHFHHHDRLALSFCLLCGIGLAFCLLLLEHSGV